MTLPWTTRNVLLLRRAPLRVIFAFQKLFQKSHLKTADGTDFRDPLAGV
ncbi:hypothetical protein QFZ40_004389 [Arthrobacter pascens]|nr:hypothetical protein [Arthrobacter pascens]